MKAETNVSLNRPSRGLGGGRMGGRDNRPYERLQQVEAWRMEMLVVNRQTQGVVEQEIML